MIRRFIFAALGMAAAITGQEAKKLSNEELKELLKQDVFLLDVREPKEIEELGTLKGYVNIPLGQLEGRLKELPKDRRILVA